MLFADDNCGKDVKLIPEDPSVALSSVPQQSDSLTESGEGLVFVQGKLNIEGMKNNSKMGTEYRQHILCTS